MTQLVNAKGDKNHTKTYSMLKVSLLLAVAAEAISIIKLLAAALISDVLGKISAPFPLLLPFPLPPPNEERLRKELRFDLWFLDFFKFFFR